MTWKCRRAADEVRARLGRAALLALLLAAASAGPAGAYRGQAVFLASGGLASQAVMRPGSAWLSGDSTLQLRGMRWARWNTSVAHGRGFARIATCDPDCGGGPHYILRAHVELRRPLRRCGDYYYTRWRISLDRRPPAGIVRLMAGDISPLCF